MKRFAIIVGSIVVVIVLGTAVFYLSGGIDKVRSMFTPKNQTKTVTISGKVLCLPPKDSNKINTLVCAVGIQANDGKYYGLSGSDTSLSAAAGSDKTVTVKGTLTPQTDAAYKMDGMLTVSSFAFSS